MLNALTIDVEHWYHANYPGYEPTPAPSPTDLDELVGRLQAVGEQSGVRMTCFILGSVAREYPGMVRRLHRAGHEIASHGYAHQAVSAMSEAEFREDIRVSCGILSDLTGEPVGGFRAPSFSVNSENLAMYYDVLEDSGLTYSSSVFPGKTCLYGIPDFPPFPHRPVVGGRRREVVEIPVPRLALGTLHLGLYLRLFPAFWIRAVIQRRNRDGIPVVLYVHPREIDVTQPRIDVPRLTRIIHYFGISTCERTIRGVLRKSPAQFGLMREIAAATRVVEGGASV